MKPEDIFEPLSEALTNALVKALREQGYPFNAGDIKVLVRSAKPVRSEPEPEPPYHGRWDELSVEDVKMLVTMGVEID